jgi:hypothetical protein
MLLTIVVAVFEEFVGDDPLSFAVIVDNYIRMIREIRAGVRT